MFSTGFGLRRAKCLRKKTSLVASAPSSGHWHFSHFWNMWVPAPDNLSRILNFEINPDYNIFVLWHKRRRRRYFCAVSRYLPAAWGRLRRRANSNWIQPQWCIFHIHKSNNQGKISMASTNMGQYTLCRGAAIAARWILMFFTQCWPTWHMQSLFATALTLSDGVLTPAVSVTSAVSGIAIAKPSVIKDIVGISILFLLALFFIQQFGTTKLAFMFAPSQLLCKFLPQIASDLCFSFVYLVFVTYGNWDLQYHLLPRHFQSLRSV